MTAAIALDNLRKHYGATPVLRGVNLTVPAGGLFGFLGPNGAGKTTTIRILLGLLRATGGNARVLGRDPWRDGPDLRAAIGYLPGDVRLYERWTGLRTLRFFNAARGGAHGAELDRLVNVFQFDTSKRVRKLSRGNKQKLGLIIALMHQPELLILDEPTTGLDPLMQETLYRELRAATRAGRTVLFSSHTLAEVESLCDEVAIVRDGLIIEHATIDALRRRALRHVEVHFADARAATSRPPAALDVQHAENGTLIGAWAGPCDELVRWLATQPIRDVMISPPDLDDLFRTYYGDPTAAAAPASTAPGGAA